MLRFAVALGAAGLWSLSPLAAQAVSEVQVTPETMTLGVGERGAVFATAYDAQGNLIPNARFTFWSSDTLVARAMRDGTIVGVRAGLAKVEARTGGRRASMAVLVNGAAPSTPRSTGGASNPPPKSMLSLAPTAVLLVPSENVQMTARILREDGTPVEGSRIAWKSLRPEVASVNEHGVVVGVAPGSTIVQASAGSGLFATVPVEVQQAEFILPDAALRLGPEDVDTLRAVVPAQGNRELRAAVQWRSSDSSVVRVGPTGIVQAVGPGSAEVVATAFSQERRATITVHKMPQTFLVSPRTADGPILVPVGGTRAFSATAEAADSSPIPEARVSWAVGDSSIAAFDETARVLTARAAGTTTLTARLRGFPPMTWTVRVVPGAVGLDRSRLGLPVDGQVTLGASLLGDDGSAIGPATDVRWRADRPEVLRVGPRGELTGVGFGRAVVTAATPWGKSDSAVVFVGGDLLVSSDRRTGVGIYQLRLAAPDNFVPLLVDSATNVDAVYSPDRTRIAFSSDRAGGDLELYVMDADGGNVRRLTNEPGADAQPVWSRDGSELVFAATRGGGAQIHRLRADGTGARALTASPGSNTSPTLSADGRVVVFVSTRDGNSELYRLDLATGIETRLTNTSQRETEPTLLPNGDLVYTVDAGGRGGSRLMRLSAGAASREPVALAVTEQPILSLAVSPDGTRAAYVTGRLPERGKGKALLAFYLQTLGAPAGTPVRLVVGERVFAPSF